MVSYLRQTAILGLGVSFWACSVQSSDPSEIATPCDDNTAPAEEQAELYPDTPDVEDLTDLLDPQCEQAGCVRRVSFWGAFDRDTVKSWVPSGVTVDNGYSVWLITYATKNREARATITLPFEIQPPHGGFHIGLNNPPTVGMASRCAPGSSAAGAGLAAQFGSRGMVGVAIDYPGLGTFGVHPYLVAESEAKAVLDGARAVLNFLDLAEIPISRRMVIAGLSQGGHATISAAAIHESYAPELDIRAFAAAAPANMFLELWSPYADTSGRHLTFYALMAKSWSHYYEQSTHGIFNAARLEEIEEALLSKCLYEEDGDDLWSRIGTLAGEIFSPEFRAALSTENLEEFTAIEMGFAANRLKPYDQTAPLRIYQGSQDATVPPSSTQSLVLALQEGGVNVEYEELPFADHMNTAFGYLITNQYGGPSSHNWLLNHLDNDQTP